MFLPISRSIYCGALSPSALEAAHCTDECLRRDVQKLMFLPVALPELTELLSGVLRNHGVVLPPFPSTASLTAATMAYPDLYSPICAMREDELDCMLRLAPGMEVLTLRYSFYEALLRAEVRWLKLNLQERIEGLRSDNDARILLLRVLDEVYSLVIQIDGGPGGLKVTLAALYLDLTIVFGSLLRSTDYLDYQALLLNVCFSRRTMPDEERKYAILQSENRVKAIVKNQEVRFLEERVDNARMASSVADGMREACACKLYGELAVLTTDLPEEPALRKRLLRGVTALENHLFFLYSGFTVGEGDRYALFTDGRWIGCCFADLRERQYSQDYRCSEARAAYDWIDRQLGERCFTFLSPLISPEESLARRLRAHLQKQRALYEDNFARSFTPVGKEGELVTIHTRPFASKVVDEAEVHRMLAFLGEQSESWLSQPAHAKRLEDLFCHFLQTGDIPPLSDKEKLNIRPGCSELLYGLFLYHCKQRHGDAEGYAKFIKEVLVTQVSPDTFHRNGGRYIRKYVIFCKKKDLNIRLLPSREDEEQG